MAKDKSAIADVAKRKPWEMSQAAFDGLLTRLDADRTRAGEEYLRLRERLISIFRWKGALSPEDLADQTLDRLARKLEEGAEIQVLPAYCRALAHNVFLESRRQFQTEELSDQQLIQPAKTEADLKEARLQALEHCLARLRTDETQLFLCYYRTEKADQIDNHKLAEELGIKPSTLRMRILRIREKLENCVRACLEKV